MNTKKRRRSRSSRKCGIQTLERRCVLSAASVAEMYDAGDIDVLPVLTTFDTPRATAR